MRTCLLAAVIGIGATALAAPDVAELERQVTDAERAFARSMAERRIDDFARHLSEHAVFFSPQRVLRGKAAVLDGWRPYFEAPQAPFSWDPDQVVVPGDGTLALSTGPIRDPQGRTVARFNSIWRLEAPGTWRVVFDKGSPLSEAERKAAGLPE